MVEIIDKISPASGEASALIESSKQQRFQKRLQNFIYLQNL